MTKIDNKYKMVTIKSVSLEINSKCISLEMNRKALFL